MIRKSRPWRDQFPTIGLVRTVMKIADSSRYDIAKFVDLASRQIRHVHWCAAD
jgi:hypothetical protein